MGIKEKELFQFFERLDREDSLAQFENPEKARLLKVLSILDSMYQDLRKQIITTTPQKHGNAMRYDVVSEHPMSEDLQDLVEYVIMNVSRGFMTNERTIEARYIVDLKD